MDRRIGRAADRRAGDDGVLERLAGEDVERLHVREHDLDRAHAGVVGDLRALLVRRRDRGAARQRQPERLGDRVHGRGGAHGIAVADRGRRRRDRVDEFVVADLAGRKALAHRPFDGAGAGALALPPAVQHRPAGEHDRRDVDGRRRHDRGRRGLVAAGGEHHAVDRIAVQHLDQAEIGEVAIERRGRPLAGLLDRMHREFERDAAGRADAVAHALGQLEVVAVAGREVGAGLRDADDRLAAHDLAAGQAVVEVALEIERGRAGIVGIVEPQLRPEARLACAASCRWLLLLGHRGFLAIRSGASR